MKILLVMQDIPLNSGFLTSKFRELSKQEDVHLLVWDKREKINEFIAKNGLPAATKSRIHLGMDNGTGVISLFIGFLGLLFNSAVRKYLLSGPGSYRERLKLVMRYVPAFKIKPSIIHFEFGTLAKNLGILKKLTSAKLCVSFRGYDINYVGLDNNNYYDDVWTNADAFHFLGQDLRNRAARRGYKEDKLEAIIPPAIDTDFFTPSSSPKDFGKLIIVSVGRLVWKKGYEFGLLAVALLKKKGIPFEYRIIGTGAQLQALQFTASELGLDNDVRFCGSLSSIDVKKELNRVHIFLHPAISEGFCNAVIEAQAAGLPVICTDADGLRENISDNESGFIVPKWDAAAIAEKLEWFWKNPDKMQEFGNAGAKRANKYFRLQEQIKSFRQFYKNLHESDSGH